MICQIDTQKSRKSAHASVFSNWQLFFCSAQCEDWISFLTPIIAILCSIWLQASYWAYCYWVILFTCLFVLFFLCAISCCSRPSGLKCQTNLWDCMRMQRNRRVAGTQCSPSIWGGEHQCLRPAIEILDVGFELFDIKLGDWFFIPHFPWYSAGFSIDKLNMIVLGETGEISGNHLVLGFTSGSHPLSFPGGGWNQPRLADYSKTIWHLILHCSQLCHPDKVKVIVGSRRSFSQLWFFQLMSDNWATGVVEAETILQSS
jgi:hypothetical protein